MTCDQKQSNKALAAVRAPVGHGFAHLRNRRALGKIRTDPKWATALVRVLALGSRTVTAPGGSTPDRWRPALGISPLLILGCA
ncbi:hypothetical protein [Streptomyces cellulosae]|uniref:Transposase n=1 Tax=Streptomyces cellulosae TaxID=1968 RepID=A0ABW7XXS3_STRCE